MKKAFFCLLFLVLLAGILTGCCSHEFAPADCEHPETCQKCGEVQGQALGHDWLDATCEAAQTCTRCGKTQGNPLGHDWLDATCDTPQTCARCAAIQGDAPGHDFGTWTFTDTTMTTPASAATWRTPRSWTVPSSWAAISRVTGILTPSTWMTRRFPPILSQCLPS